MLGAMRAGMPSAAYAALMQAVEDRRRGRTSMAHAA
jgi:hypothetical protein